MTVGLWVGLHCGMTAHHTPHGRQARRQAAAAAAGPRFPLSYHCTSNDDGVLLELSVFRNLERASLPSRHATKISLSPRYPL